MSFSLTWPGKWDGGWCRPLHLKEAPGVPVHGSAESLSVPDSSSLYEGWLGLAGGSSWRTMDWKPPETVSHSQTPEVRCADELVHRQTKPSQITHHSLLHVRVGFNSKKCTPHVQQSTTGTRHLAEITSCYSQHHYLHHIHSHLWISTSPLWIIARLGEKKSACVM